jgi:hypothetical protein
MARRNRDPYADQGNVRNLFAIRCDTCGQQLARTASGYLACPNGHGGLREDRNDRVEAEEPALPSLFSNL